MAKLGDAFSPDERRKSVFRRLRPGTVVRLVVAFPEGPKPKFLVVVHVDEQCCTLIVNSEVNPFIAAHPDLNVCQVRVDAARHSFLRHDSHIACHDVLRLPTADVIRDLVADEQRFVGMLQREIVVEVIAAIKRAPMLTPADQTAIARSLESEFNA